LSTARFRELSGELLRKRLRASHEEWEQERKDSYALSGQLPPGSQSDEEAQDDLAPIIGDYLLHKYSLLCYAEPKPPTPLEQQPIVLANPNHVCLSSSCDCDTRVFEAGMLAARRLEAESPNAMWKGSPGIFREQEQMAGEDHRSHMGLMDRKDLLEPTYHSQGYIESLWNGICNSKGCWCRGGEKRFQGCNSDYWSKLGFKLYKEALDTHHRTARGHFQTPEPVVQHAMAKGYCFPTFNQVWSGRAHDYERTVTLWARHYDVIDPWKLHAPTDHTKAEWNGYEIDKSNYKVEIQGHTPPTNLNELESAEATERAAEAREEVTSTDPRSCGDCQCFAGHWRTCQLCHFKLRLYDAVLKAEWEFG
jgi:hypothetical protein